MACKSSFHVILLIMSSLMIIHSFKISKLFITQHHSQIKYSNKIKFTLFSTSESSDKPKKGNPKKSKVVADDASIEPLTQQGIDEIRNIRLGKINRMREVGINPFEYTYPVTHHADQLQNLFKALENGQEDSMVVSIAGRIMARRVFGKLAFFTVLDQSDVSIQLYLDKGRLNDQFDTLKEWTDVSDIIGVTGTIKRTEKG